jgi:endonuclease I
MHSLICLPRRLNSQRSNYKLVESASLDDWKAVGNEKLGVRHNKRRLFIPPVLYRGPYARSIGYFVLTYPTYASLVHLRVLDLRLLVKWSEEYPITHSEEYAHEIIASMQDNVNPFFIDEMDAYQDITNLLI